MQLVKAMKNNWYALSMELIQSLNELKFPEQATDHFYENSRKLIYRVS